MDVQMPEMDGFEAKGDRERCLAAGMDDYLTKPIRPDQLATVLARTAGESGGSAEPDTRPALDEAAALAYAGDDRHLMGELLGVFLEAGPGHLEAIRDAVAGADPAALLRAAHTMNGSLRVLGAALLAPLEAGSSGCGAPLSRRSPPGTPT